jgi:hypothetical protein
MVNVLHNMHPDRNVDKFKSIVEHMIRHHGLKRTIEKLKAVRLVTQQYALGQTVEPIPFCKADRDGFPRNLNS